MKANYYNERDTQQTGNYYRTTQNHAIINYYTEGSAAREIKEPDLIPQLPHDFQESPAKRSGFSFTNKLLILLSTITVIAILILTLFFQFQTLEIRESIEEYQLNSQQLSYESDIMLNEIARNYDYQRIKEVAEANNMQQNRNRVKDINDE